MSKAGCGRAAPAHSSGGGPGVPMRCRRRASRSWVPSSCVRRVGTSSCGAASGGAGGRGAGPSGPAPGSRQCTKCSRDRPRRLVSASCRASRGQQGWSGGGDPPAPLALILRTLRARCMLGTASVRDASPAYRSQRLSEALPTNAPRSQLMGSSTECHRVEGCWVRVCQRHPAPQSRLEEESAETVLHSSREFRHLIMAEASRSLARAQHGGCSSCPSA